MVANFRLTVPSPMSAEDLTALRELARMRLMRGFDARFAASLRSKPEGAPISDKQRQWLWRLRWKYRKRRPITIPMPCEAAELLARSVRKGDVGAMLVLADCLEEYGLPEWARRLRDWHEWESEQ